MRYQDLDFSKKYLFWKKKCRRRQIFLKYIFTNKNLRARMSLLSFLRLLILPGDRQPPLPPHKLPLNKLVGFRLVLDFFEGVLLFERFHKNLGNFTNFKIVFFSKHFCFFCTLHNVEPERKWMWKRVF